MQSCIWYVRRTMSRNVHSLGAVAISGHIRSMEDSQMARDDYSDLPQIPLSRIYPVSEAQSLIHMQPHGNSLYLEYNSSTTMNDPPLPYFTRLSYFPGSDFLHRLGQ